MWTIRQENVHAAHTYVHRHIHRQRGLSTCESRSVGSSCQGTNEVSIHLTNMLLQTTHSAHTRSTRNNGGTTAAAPPPSGLVTLPSVGAVA